MSTMRRIALLAAAFVTLLTSGCATSLHGLQFTKDNRLTFTAPKQNALIKVPFTLSWHMKDFIIADPNDGKVSDDEGYFAIFIDRSPVKPGQTLAAVSKNDPSCRPISTCLTKSYLANEQIYTTPNYSLRLTDVQPIMNNVQHEQYHTATVVLMDTSGHRIGESYWQREFKLRASSLDD